MIKQVGMCRRWWLAVVVVVVLRVLKVAAISMAVYSFIAKNTVQFVVVLAVVVVAVAGMMLAASAVV